MGLFKSKKQQPSSYLLEAYTLQGHRDSQEDSYLTMTGPWGDVIGLVADGVGGYAHGEFASQTVKEVFENTFVQMDQFDSVESYVRKTLYVAATMIMQKAMTDSMYKYASTTVSGFIITRKNQLYVFNVGDSRVYLLREGELKRLTVDHSLVQELIDSGRITEEQAFRHPKKNIITKYLGANLSDLEVDVSKIGEMHKGDLLIASTDGLHDYVRDNKIQDFVKNYSGKESLAKVLCEWAFERGSKDNITVVTCQKII